MTMWCRLGRATQGGPGPRERGQAHGGSHSGLRGRGHRQCLQRGAGGGAGGLSTRVEIGHGFMAPWLLGP